MHGGSSLARWMLSGREKMTAHGVAEQRSAAEGYVWVEIQQSHPCPAGRGMLMARR